MKRKTLTRILIVLAILLSILLIGPMVIPIPPLQDTVPPEQLGDADSLFVEIDGVTMHYKTTGQGEPTLLLLHGFGASVFSWHEVMGPLAESGTIVAFDRPAFGLTGRPMPGEWEGESPYGLSAQVAQTVELMDALGLEKAILIGNSAGGTVATRTALEHPERVRALILVSPAIYSSRSSSSFVRFVLSTPQMRRLGPLFVRSIQTRGEAIIERAWHDPSKITLHTLEGYRKPLQVQNWDRALWELTIAADSHDLPERLDEIAPPVLVITGDDDRIIPPEQSIQAAQALEAGLVILPDCGHVPQEECPEEFLEAVRAFLGELD